MFLIKIYVEKLSKLINKKVLKNKNEQKKHIFNTNMNFSTNRIKTPIQPERKTY